HCSGIRHIDRLRKDFHIVPLGDVVRRRLQFFWVTSAHGDAATLGRKSLGCSSSNALARSRYNGNPVLQARIHEPIIKALAPRSGPIALRPYFRKELSRTYTTALTLAHLFRHSYP